MDKGLLDSAVRFGIELMASEGDFPKGDIEEFLSNFLVSEICDAFNYSVIRVLEEKRCGLDEFLGVYRPSVLVEFDSESESGWEEYFKGVYFDESEFLEKAHEKNSILGQVSLNACKRNDYDISLKIDGIKSVLSFVGVGAKERNLYVVKNSVGPNSSVPYVYLEFEEFGKSLYVCMDYAKSTYVVDKGFDFSGLNVGDLDDEKIIFYGSTSPDLYFYQILQKLSLEYFEKAKSELLKEIRNEYELPESLLSEPVKSLSRKSILGVSYLNVVEDIFQLMPKVGTITEYAKYELAKLVWPEARIKNLLDYSEEDVFEKIRFDFETIDNFVNCEYKVFVEYKIGNKGWEGISSYLGFEFEPSRYRSDRIKLGEMIFEEAYLEEDVEELLGEVRRNLSVDKYIELGLRDLAKLRFGKESVSLVSIFNKLSGANLDKIDASSKAELGVEIWGDRDEFVAELMTEDEWSEYLRNKYSRVEFENLSLMNTKELSFSYHRISSALGLVGQRKKISEIKSYILEVVWPES